MTNVSLSSENLIRFLDFDPDKLDESGLLPKGYCVDCDLIIINTMLKFCDI